MPRPSFGALDIITGMAGVAISGWLYATVKGKGIPATAIFGSVVGLMYLNAPARTFPTGEDVTKGIDLTGKVALVTGATSGIGVETARVLALRGAHVYIVARSASKLDAYKKELLDAVPDGKISTIVCDLDDLQSVKHCAKTFLTEQTELNILINNAGIMAVPKRQSTAQGLEQQVGVCHVGHFYLTQSLLPALTKGSARVVCLSSSAHAYHNLTACFQDPKLETVPYDEWEAYGNAKACNALMAKAIHNKFAPTIQGFSVMPGGIHTGLQGHAGLWTRIRWAVATPFFFKSIAQGAATSLVCATTADAGGEYYDNCKPNPKVIATLLEQVGPDAADRCWNLTEKLVKDLGF